MQGYGSAAHGGGEEEVNVLAEQCVEGSFLPMLKGPVDVVVVFQKNLLRYYLFEGLRYIWLARKGAFCRVRY